MRKVGDKSLHIGIGGNKMISLDKAIEFYNGYKNRSGGTVDYNEFDEQLAEWLKKLKTIENIMLAYNANWYADEYNGVPDCEVLESIWNVIQDNGLDIDIEQDYRKGKSDGYSKAIDDFVKMAYDELLYNECLTEIDIDYIAEQLKAGGKNDD